MRDGKEIYCTLCGDGGDIISCDRPSCTSSLCQSCIRRISGEEYLQRLLDDESIVWECFCCNKSPLVHYRSLCSQLCEYYAQDKQKKQKLGFVKGKVQLCSDTDSDCVAREVVSGVKVEEVKGGSVGRGEGVSGESSGERRNHTGGKEERGGREGESGTRSEKGSREQRGTKGDGGGGGGGGGDKKKPNKKKSEVHSSGSDVDSSSCDGEDSPKVDTDDVSISDSSLFEGDVNSLKRAGHRTTSGASTNSATKSVEEKSGARSKSGSPVAGKQEKMVKPKKTKRLPLTASAHRIMLSSDSDSDFQTPVKKPPSPRKRVASSSSSTSNNSKNKEAEKRAKKSGLLDFLSSGSEEENESPQKVSAKPTPSEARNDSYSKLHSPPLSPLSDEESDGPVVYATPRKLHSDSSDSDNDVMVLERRPKKNHILGSDSSSAQGEDKKPEVSTKGETAGEQSAKKKKMPRGKRRNRGDSSGEDFESREIQLRGPKMKRRRVARAIMSDSDSSSDSGSGEEEEEEDEDNSTPGRKRKKIRRVMTDAKLQTSTKEAQRAERERIERLKKRQLLGKEKDELILEEEPISKKVFSYKYLLTHVGYFLDRSYYLFVLV